MSGFEGERLPPQDIDAEQAVLGCVFFGGDLVQRLHSEMGLRPEHFYLPKHAEIFKAMVAVVDRDATPDPLLVSDELDRAGVLDQVGGKAYVHSLPSSAIAANWRKYAESVVECWRLRRTLQGVRQIEAGVFARDHDMIAKGEQLLEPQEVGAVKRTSQPNELAEEMWQMLEAGPPEVFGWPFKRLDKLTMGGMRRGQLTLVAGWSSHGKSVVIDQALESAAAAGLKVHLFINEMTRRERTARCLARLSRVNFERIELHALDELEAARVVKSLDKIAFGITDCSGWTAADVAREIRRRRYDVVGIDIFNRFPQPELRDKEESSRVLNEVTKEAQANCHILLGCHLNRNRTTHSAVLPFPSAADIRDTGMLYNDADNVLFVHRDQDEDTGEPLGTGVIRFAKVRNGRPGGLKVIFEGQHMLFRPATLEPEEHEQMQIVSEVA